MPGTMNSSSRNSNLRPESADHDYSLQLIRPEDIEEMNSMSSFATLARFRQELHEPKEKLVKFSPTLLQARNSHESIDEQFNRIFSKRSQYAPFFGHPVSQRAVSSQRSRGFSETTESNVELELRCNMLMYITTGNTVRRPAFAAQPVNQSSGLRLRRKRGIYFMSDDCQ